MYFLLLTYFITYYIFIIAYYSLIHHSHISLYVTDTSNCLSILKKKTTHKQNLYLSALRDCRVLTGKPTLLQFGSTTQLVGKTWREAKHIEGR